MESAKRNVVAALAGLAGLLLLPNVSSAVELGTGVELHAYGHQDYLQTGGGNTYMGADKRGSWDQNFLGLVGSFTLNEKSKLWAQLEASTNEATRFTWFFLDYQFNDNLRGHFGRTKFPIGLYNEVINVKFLHLSSLAPSIYQSGADMVYDAYHGAGLDYDQQLGNGTVTWQAYAGNVYTVHPETDVKDRRLFGGRITYRTPIEGLRFMISPLRTQVEILADHTMSNEDRVWLSADYTNNGWDIKAEQATHKFLGVKASGYYVQVGRQITEKWTPFVRYDYITTDSARSHDPSFNQKTIAVGVSYKFMPNMDVRVENHFNRGYALPVSSEEIPAGAGRGNWNMFAVGVNFAF